MKLTEKIKSINWIEKLKVFKNKRVFITTLFVIYALFLDDEDIFTLISQNQKLAKIKADKELVENKLAKTKYTLKQLDYSSELERYAREQKMFKKDDEDVFIITNE